MKILGLLTIATVALAGCAGPMTSPGAATPTASPPAIASPAQSSVPCPSIDATPLPPECIPYDPQALMDSNERYKDRHPVKADQYAAFDKARVEVVTAIEEMQSNGDLTTDAIKTQLKASGFGKGPDGAYAWEQEDGYTFGGLGPLGGCVEGAVTETVVEMKIMGAIMDGGCYPAVGH